MPVYEKVLNRFNRGEVSPNALTRVDVDKLTDTCEEMTNFIPERLGPMSYRPGFEYIEDTNTVVGVAEDVRIISFVSSDTVSELLVFQPSLQLKILDTSTSQYVQTSAVTTTLTTEDLTGGTITGWSTTGTDTNTGALAVSAGAPLTGALLMGGFGGPAILFQTAATVQTGAQHSLRITISIGRVVVKIGTTGGRSSDIALEVLGTGSHILTFTPAATWTVTFENNSMALALIDECTILGSGDLALLAIAGDLDQLRGTQSADVMYLTTGDATAPLKVIRRGVKSWSAEFFIPEDGPFGNINTTDTSLQITTYATGTSIDYYQLVTVIASRALFDAGDTMRLLKVVSPGQIAYGKFDAAGQATNAIKITGRWQTAGTGSGPNGRNMTVEVTGSSGAVRLQQSVDGVTWADTELTYSAPSGPTTINDQLDAAVLYYRLKCTSAASPITASLTTENGATIGIGTIVDVTTATTAVVRVLNHFNPGTGLLDWYWGSWQPSAILDPDSANEYPTSCALFEGRLWLSGNNQVWGSVSDEYESFDDSITGDSVAIRRTIGFGPSQSSNWMQATNGLLIGTALSEIAIRSSTFGEYLTNFNAALRSTGTNGSAYYSPVQVDNAIVFIQRTAKKLLYLVHEASSDTTQAKDLMLLHSEIASAGIREICVARQPETRIFAVLNDGTMLVFLLDVTEDVEAWSRITHPGGSIVNAAIVQESDEDRLYVTVNNGATLNIERLAKFDEARGASLSKHLDSFKTYTSPGTTITGLTHLEGETVTVWADGVNRGTFVVASGQITVPSAWTNVVVGLAYTADYTSNRISSYTSKVIELNRRKRITDVGLIMRDYYPGAVQLGPTIALLEAMPLSEAGTAAPTTTQTDYDYVPFEFNGENETDPRIRIRATGPATILALTYTVKQDTGKGSTTLESLIDG